MSEQPATDDSLKPQKTWSHLAGQRRKPSEYEIVSVNTLFTTGNPDAALELSPDLPMNRWIRRYRKDSLLQHDDWNAFRDPDAMIYRKYCTQRDKDEAYVDGLLSQHDDMGHDATLDARWVARLAALYTPMRYLLHTAQMGSAYLVTMAPASTIANCADFQMGDQFRWVSRVAYRTAELRKTWPDAGFALREREHWEKSSGWQGFRELMERVLATYDWGEAIIAMNLVALPAIDEALTTLARHASAQGDTLTRFLVAAQLADSQRRERWTEAFVALLETRPGNADFIASTVERWRPLADKAIRAYGAAFDD